MRPSDSDHPLRRWRLDNNLTGEQLGKMIGGTKFAISDYENRRRRPKWLTRRRIAEGTGGALGDADFGLPNETQSVVGSRPSITAGSEPPG